MKPSTDFPIAERADKVLKRRCWRCFTCVHCGTKHGDKQPFFTGTAYCGKCYKETCEVCNKKVRRSDFPPGQINNRMRNTIFRCNGCHICADCGEEKASAKSFEGQSTRCKRCESRRELVKCSRCDIELAAEHFDANNVMHSKASGRKDRLVCKTCRSKGFSPMSTKEYPCKLCQEVKGCKEMTEDLERYERG